MINYELDLWHQPMLSQASLVITFFVFPQEKPRTEVVDSHQNGSSIDSLLLRSERSVTTLTVVFFAPLPFIP